MSEAKETLDEGGGLDALDQLLQEAVCEAPVPEGLAERMIQRVLAHAASADQPAEAGIEEAEGAETAAREESAVRPEGPVAGPAEVQTAAAQEDPLPGPRSISRVGPAWRLLRAAAAVLVIGAVALGLSSVLGPVDPLDPLEFAAAPASLPSSEQLGRLLEVGVPDLSLTPGGNEAGEGIDLESVLAQGSELLPGLDGRWSAAAAVLGLLLIGVGVSQRGES